MIAIAHWSAASFTNMPHWVLDASEARQVAIITRDGMKHFNIEISDKLASLMMLGSVLSKVYATRIITTIAIVKERRAAAARPASSPANGVAMPSLQPEPIGAETGFAH